jgi:hypothetical protein
VEHVTPLVQPGIRWVVDCNVVIPNQLLVLSAIMLLPSFISILRNRDWFRLFAAQRYTNYSDVLHYTLFYGYLAVLVVFKKPPERILTDGVYYFKVTQKHRIRTFLRTLVGILVWLFSGALSALPFFYLQRRTHDDASPVSVSEALKRYKGLITERLETLKQEEEQRQAEDDELECFMANLLSNSMARKVNLDADGFDLPVDNCASRNITPFASDCTNVRPYTGRPLQGIGTTAVPQVGHVRWKIYDNDGNEAIIDDP